MGQPGESGILMKKMVEKDRRFVENI